MTEQEAIDYFKNATVDTKIGIDNIIKTSSIINISIEALEKQIPYKPVVYEDKYYSCKCGNVLMMKWKFYNTQLIPKHEGLPYCLNCGQKIDWSE